MRTIITTVGTSLLTNRNDDRPRVAPNSTHKYPPIDQLADWLSTADPRQISAETHTWFRLGTLDNLSQTADEQIILIHSETPDGQFCAERLKEYAEQHHLQASIRQVNELSYSHQNANTFNRGLSRLVRVLAETIRAHQLNGEVIIAATGGFKAEIAVANLVGTLLGVPVCYIYQQFDQLIIIEPIPITLQPEWLRDGAGKALLHQLAQNDCLPRREIESYLKADGKLELLIETDSDNELVCLNMLGELAAQILESPVVDWPETCDILPNDKIKLQNIAHHRPSGWESIVNQLSRSQFIRQIRYDGTAGKKAGIFPAKDNACDLLVVIADDTAVLGLRVETTAETAAQRQLVIRHLSQKLKL